MDYRKKAKEATRPGRDATGADFVADPVLHRGDLHTLGTAGRRRIGQAQAEEALEAVGPTRLWVNPDCGLKTRGWDEIERQLTDMVAAARSRRQGAA